MFELVESDPVQEGEVAKGAVYANSALILTEGHIERPVPSKTHPLLEMNPQHQGKRIEIPFVPEIVYRGIEVCDN